MRKFLLFLLFASWLSACNHRHEEFPSLFWDSIALHDSILLPDSLLDKGLQQAIEADDSLHISLIYFFKGKKLHQDFFLLELRSVTRKPASTSPLHHRRACKWNWTSRKLTFAASIISPHKRHAF